MRQAHMLSFIAVIGATVSGCAGMTQLQDSITKFDQSAHSVSTAEIQYLDNIRELDCNAQFLNQAVSWSASESANFSVNGICTPAILTDKQLQVRQNVLDAITLYADQMQTLVSSGGSKTLNTNAQQLATNLNTLAKDGKLGLNSSIEAGVEAGIIGITDMILDAKRIKDAQSAADKMRDPIHKVVSGLEKENLLDRDSAKDQLAAIESGVRVVAAGVPAGNPAGRFAAIMQGRALLQSANPFWTVADLDSGATTLPDVGKLNLSLEAISKANDAIATKKTSDIVAAVSDLVARAEAAQSLEAALAK